MFEDSQHPSTFVQVAVIQHKPGVPPEVPPMVLLDYVYCESGKRRSWLSALAQLCPFRPVATWGEDRLAMCVFPGRTINLLSDTAFIRHIRCELLRPGNSELALKIAYRVAHYMRTGLSAEFYVRPDKLNHTPNGCWQPWNRKLLTPAHLSYAAADAYATIMLYMLRAKWQAGCDAKGP